MSTVRCSNSQRKQNKFAYILYFFLIYLYLVVAFNTIFISNNFIIIVFLLKGVECVCVCVCVVPLPYDLKNNEYVCVGVCECVCMYCTFLALHNILGERTKSTHIAEHSKLR